MSVSGNRSAERRRGKDPNGMEHCTVAKAKVGLDPSMGPPNLASVAMAAVQPSPRVNDAEPMARGRVLLETDAGRLEIAFFPDEAPNATRNFLRRVRQGYYDGVLWHRVLRGALVQAGDPTGTGRGGRSSALGTGRPFGDEFSPRLRFKRRGLVACANAGEKDSNGSQFFMTLAPCDWLDGQSTIFGSLTGHGWSAALTRLGSSRTEPGTERPIEPRRITRAKVLEWPFANDPEAQDEDISKAGGTEGRLPEAGQASTESESGTPGAGRGRGGSSGGDTGSNTLSTEQRLEKLSRDQKLKKKNKHLLSFGGGASRNSNGLEGDGEGEGDGEDDAGGLAARRRKRRRVQRGGLHEEREGGGAGAGVSVGSASVALVTNGAGGRVSGGAAALRARMQAALDGDLEQAGIGAGASRAGASHAGAGSGDASARAEGSGVEVPVSEQSAERGDTGGDSGLLAQLRSKYTSRGQAHSGAVVVGTGHGILSGSGSGSRKRRRDKEEQTLARLAAFREQVRDAKSVGMENDGGSRTAAAKEVAEEGTGALHAGAGVEAHGLSRANTEADENLRARRFLDESDSESESDAEGGSSRAWMAARLRAARHIDDSHRNDGGGGRASSGREGGSRSSRSSRGEVDRSRQEHGQHRGGGVRGGDASNGPYGTQGDGGRRTRW